MSRGRADELRVLMTADTIGGVWTYAIDLIAALRPHGVRVALATLGEPLSIAQRRQVDALTNATLFESRYKLEWMNDPWADVEASGRWLLDIEQRFRPDVIHLNGYAHGREAFVAPVLCVAHSCCLSWWKAVHGTTPPAYWDRYRSEVTAGLAGADAIVAPSHAMADAVESFYTPQARPAVIYNGRPAGRFAPAAKREVVFSAGRFWDEAKNLTALQHVAADVPWPIEVAGHVTHPDGRTDPPTGVVPLGQLGETDLAKHLSAAAIYALPARYEPFGLSVLEAALSGCALVLGDIPSLREIWADAALYVDPNRPADLAAAINGLIADAAERQRLAAQARQRASRYAISTTAAAYKAVYDTLVATHPFPPGGQAVRTQEFVA